MFTKIIKYVHQMVKIKKENLVFSELQEVKPI